MRLVYLVKAAAGLCSAMFAATSAFAQNDMPGPFSCVLGDSSVVLYANDDGTRFTGEMEVSAEYGDGSAGSELSFTQKYSGWRTVYEAEGMIMVITGDAAQIYGDFGTADCFASRSVPAGEDAAARWAPVRGGGQTWMETEASGQVLTWGGTVRAGPGTEFARVTGLPMGRAVTLLAKADRVWLEEFPWYKVLLADGREGYIAGGLLCSPEGRDGFYNARNCEG